MQIENTTYDRGNGFHRGLIYSGFAKGILKIAYREFSDNQARSAFNQELSYDISDGDEVGFHGARIKVLKATNTTISYVVLKPLDLE